MSSSSQRLGFLSSKVFSYEAKPLCIWHLSGQPHIVWGEGRGNQSEHEACATCCAQSNSLLPLSQESCLLSSMPMKLWQLLTLSILLFFFFFFLRSEKISFGSDIYIYIYILSISPLRVNESCPHCALVQSRLRQGVRPVE